MASASATALSWRPLPFRPRSYSPVVSNILRQLTVSAYPRAPCLCRRNSLGNFILRSSFGSPFLNVGLKQCSSNFERRRLHREARGVRTARAGMRLDPGGGNNNEDGGVTRVIVNLALAGGLTYLTVTGKLGWVFDAILSLWLLAVLIPLVSFLVFLWFAEREIVKGACPNCGQDFQVFEFALKQEPNLCPYCAQPFKLDNERQFVRDEPRFSEDIFGGFGNGFGPFGREGSSYQNQDPGGVIVDVEAEVVDRD